MNSKDLIFTVLGDTWVQVLIRILCIFLGGGLCEVVSVKAAEAARSQSSRESDERPKARYAPAGIASVGISREIRTDGSPPSSSARDRTGGREARGKETHSETGVVGPAVAGSKGSDARASVYYFTGPRCVFPGRRDSRDKVGVQEKDGSATSVVPNGNCWSWSPSIPWKWRSLSEIRTLPGDVRRR